MKKSAFHSAVVVTSTISGYQAFELDEHDRQMEIVRINNFYWEILFFSRVVIILPSEVG